MNHIKDKTKLYLLLIVMLIMSITINSQNEISEDDQYLIFLKILSYNKNLDKQVGETLTMGIVYQEKYRASSLAHDRFMRAAKKSKYQTVKGIPIKFVSIPLSEEVPFLSNNESVDVLYITPLRAFDLEDIISVSRALDLITITPESTYCEDGISTGLELVNNHVNIVINLLAAETEGTKYGSQLLKLARIEK